MWPLILAVLRRNAVFITLPFAGVIGFIGYNIESLISDKYTPYSKSIQETRAERLTENLDNAQNVAKLQLKENVLERNLSPSLRARQSS